jgi:SSS family solute:Na+ symporter
VIEPPVGAATAGTPFDVFVLVTYFVAVVGFGLYFGKYSSTTKDFYFGGQRFAWWLISFSAIATTVGSYSFIKYSQAGYEYGISSTQSYLNDWFWMPILLLVWLPIIYYQRIQSVPEYFERRFGTRARVAATVFILIYLIGYVGINLYTLGQALNSIIGWPIFAGAVVACGVVTLYVVAGGQTSVIMTDLAQGMTLLVVGMILFFAGVWHLGGFPEFWSLIPQRHRYLFSEFSSPAEFSFIGIYGQDGLANSGAFILMNQGMMMRFLAMRSISDARKMAVTWILVLAPLAAITVSGGGWIARALVENGELVTEGKHSFVHAAEYLCKPGLFGFVLAALMAALMSTADTLINAVSAVFVNDIYRPYFKRDAGDKHYLRVARVTSLLTAAIGLSLVPVFEASGTIYQAHGMFTAAVTPPIVMAIFLGVLWRRFNAIAALVTMLGGGFFVFLSFRAPFDDWFLAPFSFGMGADSYGFTRAIFGLVISGVLGIAAAALTKPQPFDQIRGLIAGTQIDAMRIFKGGEPNRSEGKCAYVLVKVDPALVDQETVLVPREAMEVMKARAGDVLYVCDRRWWFGGLRSVHSKAGGLSPDEYLYAGPDAMANAHFKDGDAVYVEKLL